MLGIGGGIAFIPLLYIILPYTNIDQSQLTYIVIGTSLLAASFGTFSSARKHFFLGNTVPRKGLYLASGSIISAFISPMFAVNLTPHLLHIILAVILVLVAIKMMFENRGYTANFVNKPIKDFYLFFFGLFIGLVAGFAGIGGGILYVPVLVYLYLLNFKKAIGTSSLVTLFTTSSSALSYALISPKGIVVPFQIGYIYLFASIPLGLGSALGALNGVKIVLNSKTRTLKKIFSVFLLIAVIKIIFDL